MGESPKPRRRSFTLTLVLALFILTGLFGGRNISGEIEVTPVLLPMKLALSPAGLSLMPDWHIVTPLFTVSVQAKDELLSFEDGPYRVIVRDDNAPLVEQLKVYEFDIRADDLEVVLSDDVSVNRLLIRKAGGLQVLMGDKIVAEYAANWLLVDVTGDRRIEVEIKTDGPAQPSFWDGSPYVPFDMYRRVMLGDAIWRFPLALVADAALTVEHFVPHLLRRQGLDSGIVSISKWVYFLVMLSILVNLLRRNRQLDLSIGLAITIGVVVMSAFGVFNLVF